MGRGATSGLAFLHDYRIAAVDDQLYREPYGAVTVDTDNPLHDEPLVRLEDHGVAYECYYARSDGENPPYYRALAGSRKDIWLRRSVAVKLAATNELLRAHDRELFVLDGYRPIACQRELWTFHYQYAIEVHGCVGEAERRACAERYVVDPSSFDEGKSWTWPAHTTGGAVDLTLRERSGGELLEMGTVFEDISESSRCDFFERQLDRGEISPTDPRLINRRLLHWAMTRNGFLNDPIVFWHYDWGNQNHVKNWRAFRSDPPPAAFYGYTRAPG